MKLIFVFLALICVACMGPMTDDDKLLMVIKKESDLTAKSLNLYPIGFGILGPGKVKGVTLSYDSYQGIGIDQARKLIVKLGNRLLDNINLKINSEKLEHGSVEISFLRVVITFPGKGTLFNEVEDELALVNISGGIINYKIFKAKTSDFITIYSEPYEEAYKKVFGEN